MNPETQEPASIDAERHREAMQFAERLASTGQKFIERLNEYEWAKNDLEWARKEWLGILEAWTPDRKIAFHIPESTIVYGTAGPESVARDFVADRGELLNGHVMLRVTNSETEQYIDVHLRDLDVSVPQNLFQA